VHRRSRVLISLFLPLALAATLGPAAASPSASACTVTVALDPPQLTATITATQPGAVVFYGNVSIQKPPSARAVVNLVATLSADLAASISPASMTFSGGVTSQSFAMAVVVPAGEPDSFVGTVTVEAHGTVAGLSCTTVPVSVQVLAGPYYSDLRATLTPADAQAVGSPPAASFVVTLTLTTNVAGTVSVALAVEPPTGASTDAPAFVTLASAANGTANGSAKFHVRGMDPGSYSVIVRAHADSLGLEAAANATVLVSERTAPVDLVPGAALVAIAAAAFASRHRRSYD
jgi:hypothetical protein